ncbi:hypothetical protein [Psychrobacillus lasiicapitis]|uniref:Uncharacterized protein n=1 Tax=Psychrobacillus lasiicapitis TaxID=1636719 RepID=A0A544TAA9_9BACI|nr:hypothetical protein [Psychrobacillus lasiicapitis]TQR14402.1 hypothetical protein FG382_08060 [Psychrobacillus lasiicapitis]GGA31663.1 hypothetical protein GCM10011384_21490 [Psychrobacillus lasiicapitis]
MAYEPTEWKNREVEKPRTFTVQNNDDGTITLIPAEGQVTEPGTPITASNMNKIEQGIFDISREYMPKIGGDFTGPITVNGKAIGGDDIDARTETVTYFIRATGDDNNDGLTSGTAFKSFHKAITSLKKINFGKRILNVGASVDMSGPNGIDYRSHELAYYLGGAIEFHFSGNEYAPNWSNCTAKILVQGFHRYDTPVVTDGFGTPSTFTNCVQAEIVNMTCDRTGKQSAYSVTEFQNVGWGRVANSSFVNADRVVSANNNSYVFTWGLSGNVRSNVIPFASSSGSILELIGNTITGYTVRDEISSGGQIFGN